MSTSMPQVQDLSLWDGTPFFQGSPEAGRHVYVVKTSEEGEFLAYGIVESSNLLVFRVHGSDASQMDKFVAEMKAEAAAVTYGAPPFETQTGGDKPPPTGPAGIKRPTRPAMPQ